MCVFKVGGDKAAVTLLSCSIPHLKAIDVPVSCKIAYVEIDSNCGLNHGKDTVCV
jgi:hypothetical protein